MNARLIASGVGAALLTGCAGYNHTLFMTKSNVGLDFDSKPPTLEVNVSRKEAVIAPSFEGGQTPPVLASFKPSAGAGGSFGSFFMGVDQTFAGGDAALAMAKLYNKPTATDAAEFDSALELSKKPDYRNWFQEIPDAGATRPLIFGTDTSLGIKAAWTGTGGQLPDTVKIGFNRKEFAWSPVSATPKLKSDGAQDGTRVLVKMPAFLATVESSQNLDTNGTRVEALQYFATGESATQLAMKKEVRAAMHARLDPNSAAFKSRFSSEGLTVIADILFYLETMLDRFARVGDKKAEFYLQQLDAFASPELPVSYGDNAIPIYVLDATNLLLRKNSEGEKTLAKTIAAVEAYFSSLTASQQHLRDALSLIEQKKAVNLQSAGNTTPITADMVPALAKDLTDLKTRAEKLSQALSADPDVQAAYGYVQTKISAKN
jgi:hypothetical protein